MDRDQKFWLSLWLGLAGMATAVVITVDLIDTPLHQQRAAAVVAMVAKGVDPLKAACAMKVMDDRRCDMVMAKP